VESDIIFPVPNFVNRILGKGENALGIHSGTIFGNFTSSNVALLVIVELIAGMFELTFI
jgi:hypothetical protein